MLTPGSLRPKVPHGCLRSYGLTVAEPWLSSHLKSSVALAQYSSVSLGVCYCPQAWETSGYLTPLGPMSLGSATLKWLEFSHVFRDFWVILPACSNWGVCSGRVGSTASTGRNRTRVRIWASRLQYSFCSAHFRGTSQVGDLWSSLPALSLSEQRKVLGS